MNTNEVFSKGKLTSVLDNSSGSNGKGKIGAFITEHADNWQFCCNTFMPQAGHWVRNDNGDTFFYQSLNSCAYQDGYEKMYLGPGSTMELPAFFREMEENNVDPKKIGISPVVAILQDIDAAYERGEIDLDGNPISGSTGTMKSGSTCHGSGASRARKILRKPNVKLARDIPELKEFLCDVPGEIMTRLDNGQAGLLEIAQGFQLSYLLPEFYPCCTSRNCTISAGLDDMMLPPKYAGNVILNLRTYPIRISNKKYIGEDGSHLTWDDIQNGVPHEEITYNSGPGYKDQEEITWEEVTEASGSKEKIVEMTSVTKLPRRVFTFSKENLEQAIRHNDTGNKMFLSLNFANYVDGDLTGVRGGNEKITEKLSKWVSDNIGDRKSMIKFIGTGALTDDMIVLG